LEKREALSPLLLPFANPKAGGAAVERFVEAFGQT
jgi:hypothetical protein